MTSEAGAEAPKPRAAYYPLFDYLRILLALGVFAGHAHFLDLNLRLPRMGDFCVQVFFALSGFLIGGILRDSKPGDLPRFYFNRTTRIWIPYFLAILLLGAACVVKPQADRSMLAEFFIDKVTFTYNWFGATQLDKIPQMPLHGTGNHFWSICVEEQFYLVAPLIIVLLGRFSILGILVAGGLATWLDPLSFGAITLGVLLALSEGHYGRWYRSKAAIVVFSVLLAPLPYLTLRANAPYEATAPIASFLIVALCSGHGASSRFGTFVGGLSYPFYLNHWVGLFLVKKLTAILGSVNAAIGVGLLVSLGVAAAHYVLIDRPVHQRRAGWFSRPLGLACAATGFLLVLTGLALNLLIWKSGR